VTAQPALTLPSIPNDRVAASARAQHVQRPDAGEGAGVEYRNRTRQWEDGKFLIKHLINNNLTAFSNLKN
jgi:hypothetical protein